MMLSVKRRISPKNKQGIVVKYTAALFFCTVACRIIARCERDADANPATIA